MADVSITDSQLSIMRHTKHRAANGCYCGDSKDMQTLVSLGLMRSLGFVSWCPDEYFGLTDAGRRLLESLTAESLTPGP